MMRKITALCSVMVVLSICIAVLGATDFNMENDVTIATIKNYNAPKTEDTTSSASGGIGDILGGIGDGSSGGIGDVLGGIGDGSSGGIGDVLGGIGDGSSGGIGDVLGGIGNGSSGEIGDSLGGIGDTLGGIAGGIGDSLGGIFGGGSGTVVKTTAPATTSADIGLIIPVPAATQKVSETQTPLTSVESTGKGETVDFASTSNPYKKPTATFSAGDEDETIKWLQWIFIYTHYGLKDDGITGVLDEDTIAVVKKLQHENKMTVDGNITEEVIKAAEVLYYQSILGDDLSAIEVSSDATTGVSYSNTTDDSGKENDIPVALLVVVLVIIWVLAIGGIVLLFLFKKKKSNVAKKASAEQTEIRTTETDKAEDSEIKSLSDLFEEAENKDK